MHEAKVSAPLKPRNRYAVRKFLRRVFGPYALIVLLGLSLSLPGCTKIAKNIESLDALEGRKVVAGRFTIYEDDKPIDPSTTGYWVTMHKKGECERCSLDWDSDGYIYIPVTEGVCHFHVFARSVNGTGTFSFATDAYPAVVVDPNDSIVNFGTIELRFHQSGAAVVSAFLLGISNAHLRINYVPNHDITRAEIISKLGATAEQVRDVNVVWLERRKE